MKKKEYTSPSVANWGKVSDVTKVGATHPGGDVRQGSVVPPGHGNVIPE